MRVKTSLKVVGFHKKNTNIFMMKFCTSKIKDNKYFYTELISPEMSAKMNTYIRGCLNENIAEKLAKVKGKSKK